MNHNFKKIFKITLIILFFIFIIIFIFFRSYDLIFGIKIKNVNIQDNALITNNIMGITGNAKNAMNLTLNGRIISIDELGNFNETISLFLGYNVINIKAKDKFGNIDEKNYKLIYKNI